MLYDCSNQSILKKINPEYTLEGLMLKLQYSGRLRQRANSLEKTLMLGKFEEKETWVAEDKMIGWHHRFDGHEFEQAPGVGDGWGSLLCMGSQRTGHELATEQRQ